MLLGNETRNDSGLSLSLSTTLCVFVCSKDNPAANCQEIYKKDAGAVSGAYWIKGKGMLQLSLNIHWGCFALAPSSNPLVG